MLSKSELEEQKQERLGEIRKNKDKLGGYKMKIIEYNRYDDIIVEFQDKYKAKVHTQYNSFKIGGVKNPYFPSIYNIGYIGQGNYYAKEKGRMTNAYREWFSMLQRCYDPYYLNEHPTYIDCYVCEEWHNFQNFAKWYEENYYGCNNEKMHLDKDVLVKGNKVYSPKTCTFVPQRINKLFTKRQRCRGEYPIGVFYFKETNKLRVCCNVLDGDNNSKKMSLGFFPLNKPFQAFAVYKNFKENYIKQVADEYKDLIPKKLYDALYEYKVEIND